VEYALVEIFAKQQPNSCSFIPVLLSCNLVDEDVANAHKKYEGTPFEIYIEQMDPAAVLVPLASFRNRARR
jgi:hypothetical protein